MRHHRTACSSDCPPAAALRSSRTAGCPSRRAGHGLGVGSPHRSNGGLPGRPRATVECSTGTCALAFPCRQFAARAHLRMSDSRTQCPRVHLGARRVMDNFLFWASTRNSCWTSGSAARAGHRSSA
ncbi:hypothetical protein ACFFX0_25470 [Citricoccus parietis]|uniref:Uncharacterized protein n=1 Tax=Citricoccus parietis TaxID=592307 RepID=A0ABV5G620_9MICC